MGARVILSAADGHRLGGYAVAPKGSVRGRLVVLQEIFGVNEHIRAVCDGFAADGFHAVAPALFDRGQADVELAYDQVPVARALREKFTEAQTMLDVRAAVEHLGGPAAVIGYCWGGTLAWLAAAQLPIAGAVAYYGTQIGQHLDKVPRCPALAHFGSDDKSTPPEMIAALRTQHPQVEVHVYAGAGHAFNRAGHPPYSAEAAKLARERTLAFLDRVFKTR